MLVTGLVEQGLQGRMLQSLGGGGIAFLGVSVGGALLALGIGQAVTGGWLLWHVVVANANPLDFDYFSAMFTALLQLNVVPVILAALLLAAPSLARECQWRVYFVLSAVVPLLMIGKLGASSNYWLELTAATAVLIGIQAVRLSRQPSGRRAPHRGQSGRPGAGLAAHRDAGVRRDRQASDADGHDGSLDTTASRHLACSAGWRGPDR